ncbi:hypothetical protein TthTF19_12700 [Thermus thermophilus]|uniref:PIN domain-containing protein n=2 Tax=Thermus thermophilus TaxID=274 RepID=A0A3P4AQ49_THETH|nr:PIN domain-containing protein [Thermus thermophilus]AFH39162.1 putative nucleic acid-binding protein, contains PIN domain [Thermus thermophilus JL-18]BDG26624.1 hypothetical protein TthSNM66_12600 [Thermus thermophilus]BDG29029.1 hypothetical protein TthSNM76_12390 [Thermus thermophilus]VCU53221.1 hypothetical protein TTHN1_00983 [Thermus thermophilus]
MSSSPRNGAKVFFADTSALLYLVVDHPGEPFAWVRGLLREAPLAACDLFLPEAVAALRGRRDGGHLSPRGFQKAVRSLEELVPSLYLVESSLALMQAASLLAREYPLRGADAVHLAAALALFRQVSGVFLTLDRRQYRVAKVLVPTYPVPELEEA